MPVALASTETCLIIPCYNHGSTMCAILARLTEYRLPCIIVDDGSDAETARCLDRLVEEYSWVSLIRYPQNQGKGSAVIGGLKAAQRQGFRYGLQVDADGQHDLAAIPKLLAASRNYPDALISGRPIYDESVPKSRLYSRYITHVWVWIETLSLSITDSMCGFRLYPVNASVALSERIALGKRMDFDTEIMVRLYWQGIDIQFVPTKVIYPENGISHFDLLRDNLRISWMHTRLFLAMLPKMPKLVARHFTKQRHWSQTQERKGLWGMRLMVRVYRVFGRRPFNALLYPVIGYFWLTGRQQRQASEGYLAQLKRFADQTKRPIPSKLNSFHHFMRFGEAMLDKLASWMGDIKLQQVDFPDQQACIAQMASHKGTLIIGSHLGDLEVCRALGELSYDVKINAIVFTQHAERFNQVMLEINPQSNINLIQVSHWGPETAMLLKQKLDDGEWVAIVGDRTSASPYHRQNSQSVIWSEFLGHPAPFPVGPFALASALRCPVYLMFGLKPGGKFQIHFEFFAEPLLLPRENRQQALQQAIDRYAQRLEHYTLQSPLDWFNFYDFWHLEKPEPHSTLEQ